MSASLKTTGVTSREINLAGLVTIKVRVGRKLDLHRPARAAGHHFEASTEIGTLNKSGQYELTSAIKAAAAIW